MRGLPLVVALLLLVGCASGKGGGKPDQASLLPPTVAAGEPSETEETAAVESGAAEADVDAGCDRVVQLAATGELKPAADEMASLQEQGVECPEAVLEAAKRSSQVLAAADDHIREALARRQEGDLIDAQAALAMALDLYPKYEWATSARPLQEIPRQSRRRASEFSDALSPRGRGFRGS